MNEDYFAIIDTKEKAYWLGFLYGDGYINKEHNAVILQLSHKDEDQIDRFLLAINSDVKKILRVVSLKYKGEIRKYNSYYIRIKSKKMAQNLINLGCYHKKSLTLRFNGLNDKELDLAFLMGFFDADGFEVGTVICSGSYNFLQDIKEYFQVPYEIKIKPTAYLLTLGADLFRELLTNYENTISRKRKIQSDKLQKKNSLKLSSQPKIKLCSICNCFFLDKKDEYKVCSQKCSQVSQRKIPRPTKEQLAEDMLQLSFCAMGRKYGVSDNAIRKWAKSYNLLKKKI